MINLSENKLEGQLTKSLLNCEDLEVLDVGKNRLNDTFPSWLGSLPKLQALILRHNNFHGKIVTPKARNHFSCLRVIDLSYNILTGYLPYTYLQSWVAMRVTTEDLSDSSSSAFYINIFTSHSSSFVIPNKYPYVITIINKGSERLFPRFLNVFRVIDFSSNNFTGGIPDFLGNLKGLQALNLSSNRLTGGIPSSLANITDLEALDLSQNMLAGEIPQQLTQLTSLEVFNVSHNCLVGPIPKGEQFNTFDNSSFDGNLGLCGFPLSKKCDDTDSPEPSPSMTNVEAEEDSEMIDWIIRSLGCLCGLIVGFVNGKVYITDRHHDWFMETFGRPKWPKITARTAAPSRKRHR